MPDGTKARQGLLAWIHPVGTIFLLWLVLDQIAFRGRPLAPDVIGAAWFQRGAALILGLVLAIGWFVAFRRALRAVGRARLIYAGLALVFAAICARRVVLAVAVGDMSWNLVAVGRAGTPTEEKLVTKLLDGAFTGSSADGRRALAGYAYRLYGYRIIYKDERGVARPYEPPPDEVTKFEKHHHNREEKQAFLAWTAAEADHIFWIAYAYLLGIGVMLVGSLLVVIQGRPKPDPPTGEPRQHAAVERPEASGDRDPVTEALMRDVDMTLLRRNLMLTPQQRIDQLVEMQRFAAELTRAGRNAHDRDS